MHNVFQIFHQRPHSPFVIGNKLVRLTSKLKFGFLNVNKLKRKEKGEEEEEESSHAVTCEENISYGLGRVSSLSVFEERK